MPGDIVAAIIGRCWLRPLVLARNSLELKAGPWQISSE